MRYAIRSRLTDCARCILPKNYEIMPNYNMLEIITIIYWQNSATFFSLNDLLYLWTQYSLCYLNLGYLGKKVGGQAPPEIKVRGPRPMRPPRFRHLCK